MGPEFKVVNNTFASYTARNTLSTYYYSEIIDPSWFVENRTEFIFNKKSYSLNTGVDLRYQRTKAYDDYSFEPANVWDLTKDHAYIDVYNSNVFPSPNFFDFKPREPDWPTPMPMPEVTAPIHARRFAGSATSSALSVVSSCTMPQEMS